MPDWNAIDEYVKSRSEAAFAEIVARYIDLVYSAALRSAQGDPSIAEDATQRTFCLLAKKAASLSRNTVIVGWLHKTAGNMGRELARAERRRRFYEQKAALMTPVSNDFTDEAKWSEIAPQLESAMAALNDSDRAALLLRYFQGKSLHEVAEELGASEGAAKMRVSRSLDRLRDQLVRRGVTTAAGALGAVLMANSIQAAPAPLAAASLKAIQAIPAAASTTIFTKLIFMSSAKKAAIIAALLLLPLAIVVVRSYPPLNGQQALDNSRTKLANPRLIDSPDKTAAATVIEQHSTAAANLRRALMAPWESRRAPIARIEAALAEFGRDRALALPVFMEVVNMPPRERPFHAFILAFEGLQRLGPEAMPAWPDIRQHLRDGQFAALNDSIPKILTALSPDGKILPDLLEMIKQPGPRGASWLGYGISAIVNANPSLAALCQSQLTEALRDPNAEIQLRAAEILARLPGPKNPDALPVLLAALRLEKLRDPHAYDPIVDGADVMLRDPERDHDESARLSAVQALRDFGPEAEAAFPALLEIVKLVPTTNMVRDFALIALKAVNPDFTHLEADAKTAQRLRGLELGDRAKNGSASYDDLVEALSYPESVPYAARHLASLGALARPAIPQLLAAIDAFEDFETVQLVKTLAPDLLLERIASNNLKGLPEVAGAIGELGLKMTNALPHLERILNDFAAVDDFSSVETAEARSNAAAVAEAIQKIRPQTPKLIFNFEDLHEASSALLEAIHAQDKIRGSVYKEYITQFQDHNFVPRPKLMRFVNATKADPALHRIFVDALLKKNPSLAADLAKP